MTKQDPTPTEAHIALLEELQARPGWPQAVRMAQKAERLILASEDPAGGVITSKTVDELATWFGCSRRTTAELLTLLKKGAITNRPETFRERANGSLWKDTSAPLMVMPGGHFAQSSRRLKRSVAEPAPRIHVLTEPEYNALMGRIETLEQQVALRELHSGESTLHSGTCTPGLHSGDPGVALPSNGSVGSSSLKNTVSGVLGTTSTTDRTYSEFLLSTFAELELILDRPLDPGARTELAPAIELSPAGVLREAEDCADARNPVGALLVRVRDGKHAPRCSSCKQTRPDVRERKLGLEGSGYLAVATCCEDCFESLDAPYRRQLVTT